ncbi:MAG: ABC transporter permease [Clostridiaceae bacterium]|nr:ABC transporter permease [Clostridiaceae bacterium]
MYTNSLWVLYKKEMADHLRSKRFIIIMILVAVTGLSSIYAAASGIRETVSEQGKDFVFLRLFTTSGNSIPSFISFMSFLGPLVGLALGFDAINGEINKSTLSRLLAQPIPRDTVINGKFLAGITIIALMVITLGVAIGGLGIIMIGVPPTLEELLRIIVFLIFTILYMSLWLAVSQLFSLFFKQTATSALACIAIWLFLSVFVGLLSGVITEALFPASSSTTVDVLLRKSQVKLMLNRLSPSTIYDELTVTLLNPGVRTLGPITQEQLVGAIAGALPFFQSLLLVWPHLVSLIAINMICFTVSYIYFMRQEIRA